MRTLWMGLLSHARLRCAWVFALQGINTARQRALLALLGIVVGVSAVVALISIGKSVERQLLGEFETMGTQVMHVEAGGVSPMVELTGRRGRVAAGEPPAALTRKRTPPLLPLVLAMPQVELASELRTVPCMSSTSAGGDNNLLAMHPAMKSILGLNVTRGRFLHGLDQDAMWVVLGHKIAQQLQGDGVDVNPGAALLLCGKTMYVAGLLAPASTSTDTVPVRIDESAIISVAAAARLSASQRPSSLVLRVRPEVSPVDFALDLQRELKRQVPGEVRITTSQKVIDLRTRQTQTYTRFLAALGGVSLFVGGLGILNIMLVAVVERRREIGIRVAIGADEVDIALQFLFESAALALAGGVGGVLAGLAAAAVAVWLIQLPFVLSLTGIVSALLVSLIVGLAAGVYPAFQASRQDPVPALQSS
ncbi:MAG: ABC transporter permease [Ramlibacter sp.]|nr:ABC transporter permease [Ramlibacter sp.]